MSLNLYNLHPDPEKAPYRKTAFEKVPDLVWEKYKRQPEELKKREKVLAKDANIAYQYARDVLDDPFPAGEAAIAKNLQLAYRYALYVLDGPFPAGEPTLAEDAKYAYLYARDVLDGPFPAGEAAIANSDFYAYEYASGVLELPQDEADVWPHKLKEGLIAELLALHESR